MSTSLVIERNDGTSRTDIALAEWQNIVAADSEEMESPQNPLRIKIADLSQKLHGTVFVDVQDEPLTW